LKLHMIRRIYNSVIELLIVFPRYLGSGEAYIRLIITFFQIKER
jgi:hypothetical protein